jgi:hypothetical protein
MLEKIPSLQKRAHEILKAKNFRWALEIKTNLDFAGS